MVSNVYAKADSEHWRRKYFDALKSLEQEERSFQALESLLRRLVTRLCFATLGLSPQLDTEVSRVTAAMRAKSSVAELEPLFQPLSDAIAALDDRKDAKPAPAPPVAEPPPRAPQSPISVSARPPDPPPVAPKPEPLAVSAKPPSAAQPVPDSPPPASGVFGDERIRAIFSTLLELARQDAALRASADELDAQLKASLNPQQLPVLISDIADLMQRRVHGVEREKREIELLLAQITAQLDEFTQYIAGEDAERKMSLESTTAFNSRLLGDMQELGVAVESSIDLGSVKHKVRTRLDTLSEQVHEFRAREEARQRTHWERSERMRERVEKLEVEARGLQDRLRDEQRLALIDALTQIPNRLSYDQRLTEEFKRWQRFSQPTCIAAWDIDLFKSINDAYGHRAGDKVLRIVAESLANRIRDTDFVARYGGEEFVMILAGTRAEDALKVANELRENIAKLGFHFRGAPVSVSISCGITEFRPGDSADDAFDRADKALYRAKSEGRNRCIVG